MDTINLAEELSIKLLGRLTLDLGFDLHKQLDVKSLIDEALYEYNITSKCTALSIGDIEEKGKVFLACKKLEGLSDNTLYNYSLFLKKMNLFFNKPVSSIDVMELRMFLAVIGEGKEQSTQGNYITMLKNFFTWLQNEEYIIRNPSSKLRQVKKIKQIKEPYTSEEIERLRDSCESYREKAIFETMLSSACRINELVNIKIKDIDFANRVLKILVGKGNKERITYLSTRAIMNINKYIEDERQGDSEYLFVGRRLPHSKLTTRSIQVDIKKLQIKSGVTGKVHAHRFRRTQATLLLNSGMDITGVQRILGHESPETTQRYSRLKQTTIEHEFKRIVG
ncbi:tyrosine-type recombinase/integrase [Clostridium chrysemydis]|uniref:tyrosine-type recombinase/integrase n=1 Tax=Clostridium chrysemydis TaxID=2665504 RepID=UPI0018840E33|nr:tyrosine-type recombinase/integrase [Clostridium chrysemydis]